MNRKTEDQLAAWTEAAMKQLPPKVAPAHFAQRVMERIQREAARPWYRKPWLNWPLSVRMLSVAGLGGLIYAVADFAQPAGNNAAEQLDQVAAYGSAFESVVRAIVCGIANYHPWLASLLGLSVVAAVIVTFGCSAVCVRFAQSDR